MTGLARGQPGVGVGGGGIARVGDLVGPAGGAAIGGRFDLVTGDGGAAGAARGGPGEVDLGGPAGRCREAGRAPGALVAAVVALSTLDGSPVPLVLMAETR